VSLSPSLRDIDLSRLKHQQVDGHLFTYVEPTIRDGWRATMKRLFDIVFSIISIALSLPVQIVTAIAIKLESNGPIFFRQVRVGKNGQTFEILKFRTMVVDAEARR